MISIRLFITVLMLILLAPITVDAAIKFIELYEGLPNYQENSPFIVSDSTQHANLRKALTSIASDAKQCKVGSVLVWKAPIIGEGDTTEDWRIDLLSNICDHNKYEMIRKLVTNLAPSLVPDSLTFWVADLGGDKEITLIVGYIDISKDELKYPYLSLWRLKFEKGMYNVRYAGPFLNGTFHAVEAFGTKSDRKSVFVKHTSCIECEPIIYLTAIDFEAGSDAQFYQFSYSKEHDGFDPTIEYELPGMGHTVEATVETRALLPSEKGPHLLQFFKMAEGPDEWWAFTCINYRCDYQMYKNEPPNSFKKLWKEAKPI